MRRTLRILIGEALIELGELLRDLGGFVLPNYEQHPAFSSNGDLDSNVHMPTEEELRRMRTAR